MIYLAVPYSHPDPKVRHARFVAANRAAFRLMKQGEVVFSPISHSHPIEVESGEIGDHEFWARQDDPFQDKCEVLAVLMIDGWKESKGVQREIRRAEEKGIFIKYLEPSWAEPLQPVRTAYELAAIITKGDRNDDYGAAYVNASSTAAIQTGILWRKLKDPVNDPITPRESFLLMIGGKLSRDGNRPKQDNLTDTIGYAKLIDEDPRFS